MKQTAIKQSLLLQLPHQTRPAPILLEENPLGKMHQMASNIYVCKNRWLTNRKPEGTAGPNTEAEESNFEVVCGLCLYQGTQSVEIARCIPRKHQAKRAILSECITFVSRRRNDWNELHLRLAISFVMLSDYMFGHESVLKLTKLYPFKCWKVEFRDVNGYEVKASALQKTRIQARCIKEQQKLEEKENKITIYKHEKHHDWKTKR